MRFNSSTEFSFNSASKTSAIIKPLTIAAAAIIAMGAMSTSANAKRFFSDTSVSLLYGSDYELAEDGELTTVTLEHVSAHDWGGVFFFVDRLQGASDANGSRAKDIYGELAPKFKISDYSNGFIKQVNFATQYEFGSNSSGFSQDNILVGIGADLNVPIEGTKYASASLYHAFNDDTFSTADDQQITLTYAWEKNNLLIDGYIDYSFNNDDKKDSFRINPQVKYNLQDVLGIDNRVEVGMEYSYWSNKFGQDVDESAPSALVKVHF